jgi:hypothetical protein
VLYACKQKLFACQNKFLARQKHDGINDRALERRASEYISDNRAPLPLWLKAIRALSQCYHRATIDQSTVGHQKQ